MSLIENLTSQLGPGALSQVGKMLGTDDSKTADATGAAVSTLVAALARNASSPGGAESLHAALAKDHDGSLLDQPEQVVDRAQSAAGDGILRHVLGSKRAAVEAGLSQQTGLDSGSVGKLLTTLAPVLMGALGKTQRENNLDAGALAGLLGQERQQIEQRQPGAMGMVSKLLDADGDGDLDLGDIAKHGKGLLGKFTR